MKHPVTREALPVGREKVDLSHTYRTKYRGFAVFLICCALLIAGFAVSAVWMRGDGLDGKAWGHFWGTEASDEPKTEPLTDDSTTQKNEEESESAPSAEEVQIPQGAIPVITRDLSSLSLGRDYIQNETVYRPDATALLSLDVSCKGQGTGPLVLILHTHTSESYLPAGTDYLTSAPGDVTYTQDPEQNVLAVGKALCESLNQNGISAVHCTVFHDDPTLAGSYDRSAATVQSYLLAYPTIEYVIDLHRDAVMTAEGELVRAAVGEGEAAVAQVMAVVGSDGNGTEHPDWQTNLALALQLREKLNANEQNVSRPVSLKNASFHQELSAHAILLEIGTAGNSVEEAKRAAVLVGEALAELISN